MTPRQLATSMIVVVLTAMVCSVLAFQRGAPRRWAFPLLLACAGFSIASWTDYWRFQRIAVDASPDVRGDQRPKVAEHRPFHFHEFVHYYLGPKYFRELGYLGLYDCITLGDLETSIEDGVPKRIYAHVRNLEDVLRDKPYDEAIATCREGARTRFTDERWRAFKNDLRALQRLVDDVAWPTVVFDAGFNPPPSMILLTSQIANLIPIRSGTTETFLFATSLDLVLLVLCFVAARRGFGSLTASVWIVYFGATLISAYAWNGGSLLRFSWLASIVFGLVAMKRGRWGLAGALLAAATADRIFPVAFAAFAAVPLAAKALRSKEHRAILRRFGVGFGATLLALVVASALAYGVGTWRTFFARTLHHSDVYYVFHIGLKKVFTYRSWAPSQFFHGHEGLANFRAWNLRLRDTWAAMRPLTVLVQLAAVAGTVWASLRRKPYEAAVLGGVVFLFFFNLPANYYFVIVTLIPALLFRAAATAPTKEGRYRSLGAFAAFNLFWIFTFIAPQMSPDAIIYNFYLCGVLLLFLFLWMAAWAEPRALQLLRVAAAAAPGPAPLPTAEPEPARPSEKPAAKRRRRR